MIKQIDHINLVVKDLGGMVAFYRNVLGFEETKRATISGPWIDAVVGLSDVLADVVYLELGGESRMELIHYRHPPVRAAEFQSLPNMCGLRHVAFRTDDIDRLADRLRAAGAHLKSEVMTVPLSQVQYGNSAQKRLVYLYDPEGNLLELSEYRSAH